MTLFADKNPLRMERIEQVPFRFDRGNWDSNLEFLRQLNFRAAIVGRKGSGKTTLLAELSRRLPNSHYLNLPHQRHQHAALLAAADAAVQTGQILLVDGIERIRWWQRERLYFSTAGRSGLVVVVHRRCRLPTWIECRTDEELMHAVVLDLGLDEPAIQAAAMVAFRRSRGNIRDALRLMYDQFANESLRQRSNPS
ncbi:MAG: hypothetical protein AAFN77_05040 [Planctomycetota bacterium]